MTTLAIKFKTTPDRVFAQIPRTRQSTVAAGEHRFTCYPRTGSEQCPGCGGDVIDCWRISAENPGVAEPEPGDVFFAVCCNLDPSFNDGRECGQRMTGCVVEMEK